MLYHGNFNPMPTVFHGGGHDRLVQVHDRGSKSQGNKQLYVVACVEAWMLLHRQGMSFSTRVCPVCDCCVLGSRIPGPACKQYNIIHHGFLKCSASPTDDPLLNFILPLANVLAS